MSTIHTLFLLQWAVSTMYYRNLIKFYTCTHCWECPTVRTGRQNCLQMNLASTPKLEQYTKCRRWWCFSKQSLLRTGLAPVHQSSHFLHKLLIHFLYSCVFRHRSILHFCILHFCIYQSPVNSFLAEFLSYMLNFSCNLMFLRIPIWRSVR